MVKRIVARDKFGEYTHRKFCDAVWMMLNEYQDGWIVRTPITKTIIDKPNNELLDQLDRERTVQWHVDFDEAFYADRSYLWDTYYYYRAFSIDNIFPFQKYLAIEETPKSVFDVGAGLGMTTVHLATMMPESTVYYSNVPGAQTDFAKLLFDRFAPNVEVVGPNDRPRCEMIAFLDVLEHIREPMRFAKERISDETKVILDSSAFGRMAAGHWITYFDGNEVLPAKPFKRRWPECIKQRYTDVLDGLGFKVWDKEPYGWNKMPTILYREDKKTDT